MPISRSAGTSFGDSGMSLCECYQLLGAGPDWSLEEIKAAFRRKLLAVHPDRNPADPLAAERTRQLLEAYRRVISHARTSAAPCAIRTNPTKSASTVSYAKHSRCPDSSFGIAHTLMVLVATVLIVQFALNAALRHRQLVFRPDPAALRVIESSRTWPIVLEPGTIDPQLWYWTNRYQLTLGDKWVRQQLAQAYSLAEKQAMQRYDQNQLAFCRAALRHLLNAASADLICGELFISHSHR